MATDDPSTVDRLLAAAIDRYSEGGTAAITIASVRENVGVSVGAVYHHFPDRQALIDAAWLNCLASHQAAIIDALPADGGTDPRAGIGASVFAYLAWHADEPGKASLLREPGPTPQRPQAWEARRSLNRPFFDHLRSWFGVHKRTGALRDLPPDLIHALWFGASRDICDQWLQRPGATAPTEYADALEIAAWTALATAPR